MIVGDEAARPGSTTPWSVSVRRTSNKLRATLCRCNDRPAPRSFSVRCGVDRLDLVEEVLEVACADLGISPADVVAMGDSETDVKMFRVAGASVAMGQAPATVKTAATWVSADHGADLLARRPIDHET